MTEAFVADWDGVDFEKFWDTSGYCFCSGEYCAESEEIGCECNGDEGCCCDASNMCNYGHMCKPSLDAAIPNTCITRQGSESICGSYGEFISCPSNEGVVYSTCGSGGSADCGTYSGLCPSGSYSGIRCGYPDLGTPSTNGQWKCASYGWMISCDISTPLLLGICGSGGNQDCKTKCVGYSGILCGTIDNVEIDADGCYWQDQYNWGKFVSCRSGYVGSGYCGSGRNRNCYGNKLARIKCCPLKYYNITA